MEGVVKGKCFKIYALVPLVLLSFFASCSKEELEKEPPKKPGLVYSSLELEILNLVNDHRASSGRNELKPLAEISEQALSHSYHMLQAKEVCHHNFGGRYQALADKVGARAMGENVGYGYRNSTSFFRAWLNSNDHREIIEGESSHFGISALKGEEKIYVTLIFIRK